MARSKRPQWSNLTVTIWLLQCMQCHTLLGYQLWCKWIKPGKIRNKHDNWQVYSVVTHLSKCTGYQLPTDASKRAAHTQQVHTDPYQYRHETYSPWTDSSPFTPRQCGATLTAGGSWTHNHSMLEKWHRSSITLQCYCPSNGAKFDV